MSKDYARAFYNSPAWKKCKDGYINSVDGLCEECLRQGKIEPGWIVHHKTHITPQNIHDPSITLNWENLEFLCQDCHNKVHGKNEKATIDGVGFDSEGKLVKLY